MDDSYVETIVVGAGVVGLACARDLAIRGRGVLVLEQAGAIGTETSARNSEVIHAGIYYPTGSNKAELCVEGKKLLYQYCLTRNVPHDRCGKLIVATSASELEPLDGLLQTANANGVDDLVQLGAAEVAELEPEIRCVGALLSPSTGTIDSHALMLSLQGELEDHGGMIAFNTPVLKVDATNNGHTVWVGGSSPMRLTCREFINAAGHGAIPLARNTSGVSKTKLPTAHQAKGVYFRLMSKSPFRHLIYPAPDQASLGIHATIDLGGQTRFGPDVEWLATMSADEFNYGVDPKRGDNFYAAIRKYWPGLRDGTLAPDYSGIRPKICGPGEPAGDFVLDGPQSHGIAGLINLFGIESPGLTSSLAISGKVSDLLQD